MLHYLGKIFIITLLFNVLIPNCINAQITSWNNQQLWVKADKAFELGKFDEAKVNYDKLILLDSNNQEINFNLGVCNYEIEKFRLLSKKYFLKVDAFKFNEANYYLGLLMHNETNFDEAITYFNQYKKANTPKNYKESEIDFLIDKSKTAKALMQNFDKEVEIINLGEIINTEYPEYAPLISAEENFILFTSRRKNEIHSEQNALGEYYEDIYSTKKIDKKWQQPTLLDTTINTNYNDAGTGLSPDGEQLLFFRTSEDLKTGDIYESFYMNDAWETPKKLGESINSKNHIESSAAYTTNNDAIVFSSDRPGGFGGKDLYMVKRLPNGEWGEAFNLGENINTPYNEDAPFIHPFENILYFSSQAHQNMGGYDIFKAIFNYETSEFENPVNLGYPINTVNDDIFYVLNTDATVAYLSSERKEGFGAQDLYEVQLNNTAKNLNVYNIKVYDNNNNILKKVEIILSPKPSNQISGKYKANEQSGKIIIISKPEKEYEMIINAKGFKPLQQTITLNTEFSLSFELEAE